MPLTIPTTNQTGITTIRQSGIARIVSSNILKIIASKLNILTSQAKNKISISQISKRALRKLAYKLSIFRSSSSAYLLKFAKRAFKITGSRLFFSMHSLFSS